MENQRLGLVALIGIYAALIFDIFSSLCSSPQTTQLFASDRASTLWHWVKVGVAVSVAFIALGVYVAIRDKTTDKWAWIGPLVGGVLALGLMWLMYSQALEAGGGQKSGKMPAYIGGVL
jgi:hypothetical protein